MSNSTILFIANTTKQDQDFHFRLPGSTQIMRTIIPKGQQVRVYQPAEKATLEHILKQHHNTPEPFCIHYTDSNNTDSFVGLVYSFDKPVPGRVLADRFEKNDEALEAIAQKDRIMAAAAASSTIDAAAEEHGATNTELETSVIEEVPPGQEVKGGKMNETVEVTKPEGGKRGWNRKSGNK